MEVLLPQYNAKAIFKYCGVRVDELPEGVDPFAGAHQAFGEWLGRRYGRKDVPFPEIKHQNESSESQGG